MLSVLGVSARDEAVYRAMLERPDLGLTEIAEHLSLDSDDVRSALDNLIDLSLVRTALDDSGFRAVRPQAGLSALLMKAEAEVTARQQELEAARASIFSIAAVHADQEKRERVVRIEGIHTVRDRLAELAHGCTIECLSFSTGGAQNPSVIQAEKPLNQLALERGVTIRTVYLDSMRKDPMTLGHARAMASLGEDIRTVPSLPMRMVIVDRRVALVPIDPTQPTSGAIEVSSPGVITGLLALFELVWASGTPVAELPSRDESGLVPLERDLLRLLAEGHTDESAARILAISVRSVQRMMNVLTERLNAVSRFQAGAEAVRRRWI